MPSNIVKSFAKKTNKSIQEIETKWDEAKKLAELEGHKNNYPYIVGILKHKLGINESILSFTEYLMCDELNEVKYVEDGRITSEIDKIKDLGKTIYTGNVYKIYDNGDYFIITDINDKILFYQKYKAYKISNSFKAYDKQVFKVRTVYDLGKRENVSNGKHKNLFSKLVHSLLFMGYVLQDNIQHNLFSRKSIETLYDTGELVMYYGSLNNVKILPGNEFDKVFDGNPSTNLYYVNKDITTNNILENVIDHDYRPMWVGEDLFDDIAVYMEMAGDEIIKDQ